MKQFFVKFVTVVLNTERFLRYSSSKTKIIKEKIQEKLILNFDGVFSHESLLEIIFQIPRDRLFSLVL